MSKRNVWAIMIAWIILCTFANWQDSWLIAVLLNIISFVCGTGLVIVGQSDKSPISKAKPIGALIALVSLAMIGIYLWDGHLRAWHTTK